MSEVKTDKEACKLRSVAQLKRRHSRDFDDDISILTDALEILDDTKYSLEVHMGGCAAVDDLDYSYHHLAMAICRLESMNRHRMLPDPPKEASSSDPPKEKSSSDPPKEKS